MFSVIALRVLGLWRNGFLFLAGKECSFWFIGLIILVLFWVFVDSFSAVGTICES